MHACVPACVCFRNHVLLTITCAVLNSTNMIVTVCCPGATANNPSIQVNASNGIDIATALKSCLHNFAKSKKFRQ